jgi:hypothetical protein
MGRYSIETIVIGRANAVKVAIRKSRNSRHRHEWKILVKMRADVIDDSIDRFQTDCMTRRAHTFFFDL